MQAFPLIRVQSSAFSNGSALRIKQKQSQQQNQIDQISPIKYIEDNEQSPSKIINIYADNTIYNNHTTFSDVKNQQINGEDKILKCQTYTQMDPKDVEQPYNQKQKIIKNQIKIIKDNVKNKQKEFYESKKTVIKCGIQKNDSSTQQSKLIDISRSSQNFRRQSNDQSPQIQKKQVNELNQSFHLQLQNKKQQLLNDISKLDNQIIIEQQYVQLTSKKIYQKLNLQKIKSTKSDKIIKQKQSKKTINKFLNISQNSQISHHTSPKSTTVKYSQSQEIKEVIDSLRQSRDDLNQRMQRMNEKYNLILDQSNKFRINFQHI